jgi:hypothetical protein
MIQIMTTENKQTIYAVPEITTAEFEDKLLEMVRFAYETDCWHELPPIFGHGSPGTGKSAIARQLKAKIEKMLADLKVDKKVFLHIIDAPHLEIGAFGYPIAEPANRIDRKFIALIWKDAKKFLGNLIHKCFGKGEENKEIISVDLGNDESPVAKWYRNEMIPDPRSEDIHIVIIEELASAMPSQQSLLHPVLLDKEFGPDKAPKRTIVISLGNMHTDKGHVIDITSPVANRCKHYIIKPELEGWLEYAFDQGAEAELLAFHRMTQGSMLSITSMKDYGKGNFAFYSPRSNLNGVDKELKIAKRFSRKVGLRDIQANVGIEFATKFMAYLDSLTELPSMEKILATKVEEMHTFVPQMKSDSKEQAAQMGRVYFLIECLSQYMIQHPAAEKTNDNHEVWNKLLHFLKSLAKVWGNSIAIIAVVNIYRSNNQYLGLVARIGGQEIISWLGGETKENFQMVKDLKKHLLV